MTPADELRDLIAHHVRERVRLRLGPNALGMAALGESVMLSGVEADLVGQAAVDALAGARLVAVSAEDLRPVAHLAAMLLQFSDGPPGEVAALHRVLAALPERTENA